MFISEDKKQINLPVALGTTIYSIHTDCNDACSFQSEEFRKAFPNAKCDMFSPCHVKFKGAEPIELNLNNLGFVLPRWGKTFFATEQEAIEAGENLVESHIKLMLDNGIGI